MSSTFENQQVRRMDRPESEFTDKVVEIKRVSKKLREATKSPLPPLLLAVIKNHALVSVIPVPRVWLMPFKRRFKKPEKQC